MSKKEKIATTEDLIYRLYISRSDMIQADFYMQELQKRGLNSHAAALKSEDYIIFCALVESFTASYSRPFSRNKDIQGNFEVKSIRDVMNMLIPKEYMNIHKSIIALRDGFHAHSDMEKLKPIYHRSNMMEERNPFSVWNEELISRSDRLVNGVVCSIARLIQKLESECPLSPPTDQQ